MRLFRKRIEECLERVSAVYEGLLLIPHSSSIILNREFMVPNWMAHESQANKLNIISLNTKLVEHNKELYAEEIIPHELAHVICRVNPILYSVNDHCKNWQELCILMGGSGNAYIDDSLVKIA